jgi:hypothetical protein
MRFLRDALPISDNDCSSLPHPTTLVRDAVIFRHYLLSLQRRGAGWVWNAAPENDIRVFATQTTHEARLLREGLSFDARIKEAVQYPNDHFLHPATAHRAVSSVIGGTEGVHNQQRETKQACSCAILPTAKAWPGKDLQSSQFVASTLISGRLQGQKARSLKQMNSSGASAVSSEVFVPERHQR